MHFGRNCFRIVLGTVTVAASLWAASGAQAANGPGSLYVAGASTTPTHWNIPIGVPTNAEIQGVGSEVGSPLPATITVIVKSTEWGNTYLTATQIGVTNNYAFTYTPPATANGDDFNACGSTIVSYVNEGRNSNNDLIDDGLQNGSSNTTSGFRFYDGAGVPIECTVGVTPSTWGGVKTLFQ
jgi:hypothetical protein